MSRKTRKLMWSVPLIAAVAVIGALAAFMTLTPNDASAQQQEVVPGAPTDLMLRALDQSTIELTWEAPSDDAGGVPDGYRIDYSGDGKVWYALVANHGSVRSTSMTKVWRPAKSGTTASLRSTPAAPAGCSAP